MNLDTDKLALLLALPEGECCWVRVGGTSLWPLIIDGDQVLVRRCGRSAIRVGDIAAMLLPGGVPAAHLVTALDPWRTESSTGRPDAPMERLIGRLEAVKRNGVRVSLQNRQWLLRQWPRVFSLGTRVPGLRALIRQVRALRRRAK